jgi:hypothetical protein
MAKEDNVKPRVLFIYDHRYPDLWRDGLWAALDILKEDFEISKYNLFENNYHLAIDSEKCDFILGWGAFGSPVDEVMTSMKNSDTLIYKHPMGLCLAGNATAIPTVNIYDIIFYETNWAKDNYLVNVNGKKQHAFGINTNIFNPWKGAPIIWDWLSVGSFAYWKRHTKIMNKPGTRLVVGEIQRDNWQESFDIISDLLLSGVGVSDMLYPTKLRNIYNCAGTVYIPADLNGGGERAVLEARACGREVVVEKDNPKLEELVSSPIYDEHYYAEQLKKGILECLEK